MGSGPVSSSPALAGRAWRLIRSEDMSEHTDAEFDALRAQLASERAVEHAACADRTARDADRIDRWILGIALALVALIVVQLLTMEQRITTAVVDQLAPLIAPETTTGG